MRRQTVVWTALPNGRSGGTLKLSVFVMPRLETDEGGPSPRLSLFPDFANWPATIAAAPTGPLSFTVRFGDLDALEAIVDRGPLSPRHWAAIFDPATTLVQSWQFYDFSDVALLSFPAVHVAAFLRNVYGSIGQQSPTAFPSRESLLAEGGFGPARPGSLGPLRRSPKGSGARTLRPPRGVPPDPIGEISPSQALAQALDFHTRPPDDPDFVPPTPTLDFHEALSLLKDYPRLMRMLGLVIDLSVPMPAGLSDGNTTVKVTPTWQPLLTGPATVTRDAEPFTYCTVGPGTFRATPGGGDYGNGMLDLSDTGRFSVIEVDVDGGAERAAMFAATLEQTIAGGTDDTPVDYAPPSLRSIGFSVVWNGWAASLKALARAQSDKQYELERSLANPRLAAPAFYAEDLVRGHRFDVLPVSDPSPTWRSLVGRVGSYRFPRNPGAGFPYTDEGTVVTGGTQAAGTKEPPLPDLYVHETLARWSGWSLAARRPGQQILPGAEDGAGGVGGVGGSPDNPPPPAPASGDVRTPQLSVTFRAPDGSLPRLRFGNSYRFRARAADLAGNGVPPDSTDDSTATAPVTYLRFDPVVAPTVAPVAPYGPGQGAQLIAILNHSDGSPVTPLGLWLFPPKASQLMAEEHGMFDGFSPGSPPDPARGPSGDAATYNMIVAREYASLGDGTLPGFAVDPVRNTPYFTAAKLTTPWLPDPLSAGVAMVGLPGEAADRSTPRPWAGGPWPDLEPLLLRLRPGDPGHTYIDSTARASAIEDVTLPPAGVADVALSSTLAHDRIDLLGMWHWSTSGLEPRAREVRRLMAADGWVWLLTPFRVVRLVHAVRLPLVAPDFFFSTFAISRSYGSTKARFFDPAFAVDAASTGTLDVEAAWTDPIDDPSDPANDPSDPQKSSMSRSEHAFQLTVADPSRPGPPFVFDPEHGAEHDLGDTKYHRVTYTVTATSRFAELFRKTVAVSLTVGTPSHVSDLGLDPGSVRMTTADGAGLVAGTDFTVDAAKGDITLNLPGVAQPVLVSFVPTDTLAGPARQHDVLASARPDPPRVARVVPAWELTPRGSIASGGEAGVSRRGGFLRVYLERPWYSSGAGELLGVVTLPDGTRTATDLQRPLVTLIGRDPITTSDSPLGFGESPGTFAHTATLPRSPFRTYPLTDRAVLGLAEDPEGSYNVFPYEVQFDGASNLWFADVDLLLVSGGLAPAGLFVRLALVRFQPLSIARDPSSGSPGAEVSPVVLATVAQPVPNRDVTVTLDRSSNTKVTVSVTGPSYSGWRSEEVIRGGEYRLNITPSAELDSRNPHAEQSFPNSGGAKDPLDKKDSSNVYVEVQVHNPSADLYGDLAWRRAAGTQPVLLSRLISYAGVQGMVLWGGDVILPHPVGSQPMRLRISEVDFATSPDPRGRRPFIAFIPLS